MSINDEKTLADFIPNYPTKGDKTTYIVKVGESKKNITKQIKLESVINSIKDVQDPEIPVNIYDLGLIYDIEILSNNDIKIKMSLTAPGCPVAGEMPKQVATKICELDEVGKVEVELIWDPPWSVDRMSDDAKLVLDIG